MQQKSLYDGAAYYAGLGYQPVPIARGKKACFVPGWQTRPWREVYAAASPMKYAGHGIRASSAPPVDLDIYDTTMVEYMRDWCFQNIGPTVTREGLPPKLLLPYRTSDPFPKIVSASYLAPGGTKPSRIEILGDGQQWVAEAIHPDTGRPYRWSAPLPPIAELPTITPELAQRLCDEFEATAEAMGWAKVGERETGSARVAREDPVLDALLEQGLVKKEKAAKPGTWDIRCPWVDEHTNAQDDGAAYLQAHYEGREHDGFKCHHASCQGRGLRELRQVLGLEGDIVDIFDEEPAPGEEDPYCLSTVLAKVQAPFMLIERMLRRGDLVGFLANPGSGKTAVVTDIQMRLAMGMEIGGLRVARQRVLMIAAENPEEVKLRIMMWCRINGVRFEDTRGWVHFIDRPVKVGDEAALRALMRRFGDPAKWGGRPLGSMSVDTFSANFSGDDENANTEVQAWINVIRVEAILRYGPAVIILHHPPKGATEWEDLHNWRGASAAKGTLDCTWASKVEDGVVTVNNNAISAKNRMRKFDDLYWRLKRVDVPGMIDNLGCQVETVVAVPLEVAPEGEKDVTPRWNDNEVTVLDAIEKDPHATVARIAKETGRHYKSVERALDRVKKRNLAGERKGTLYLRNSGKSLLELARSEGWPLALEVFEEEEELPKK